jgi:hypothetical protein
MKHLFIFFVSVLLLSCAGSDHPGSSLTGDHSGSTKGIDDSVTTKAMQDTSSYTSIQWLDSTSQDLGKISKGGVVEVSWRFRNTGNKPLIVASVRPGCGCTVADRPDAPVAPGKEGVIRAKYDTKEQHTGENQKNVTVVANTLGNSSHLLTFRIELTDK